MQKEKVRVYALARELNMESKDLLDICRQAGIDVKNQLSSLDPEHRDAIELLVKKGSRIGSSAPTPPPASPPVLKNMSTSVPTLPVLRPPARRPEPAHAEPVKIPAPPTSSPQVTPPPMIAEVHPPVRTEPAAPVLPTPPAPPVAPPVVAAPPVAPPVPAASTPPPPAPTNAPPVPIRPPESMPPSPPPPPTPPEGLPAVAASLPDAARPPEMGPKMPNLAGAKMRDLDQGKPPDAGQRQTRQPRNLRTRLGHRITKPPPLKPPSIRSEAQKPKEPPAQKPIKVIPKELLTSSSGNVAQLIKDLEKPDKVVAPTDVPEEDETSEDAKTRKHAGATKVPGRADRHQQRHARAQVRKERTDVQIQAGGRVLQLDDERTERLKRRAQKNKKEKEKPVRIGKVPLMMPITVRSLSEAVGLRATQLLFKLRDHGAPENMTINSMVEPELAETIAIDVGCEVEIKRPRDAEEELMGPLDKPDQPEDLVLRAPIVTIMGHVDHGKTSLLDRIRKSNIVATEAGGITQVIRAWRVEHGGRPVTFLDTPGHEAFTKMRARGAQVTDIAVIVVAADDGVMPQTEEAINHAKAAGVPIVVAINKTDLPNANLTKTRQQLYGHQLIPDTMGGDTPFVETSAATGKGIDELLDMLSLVAELKELKANPNKPGKGTCLEAKLTGDEGVVATVIVQNGTLRRGDIVLCGATSGRIRAMYDDLGRPITEAGPSVPVRITGLNEVPNADDPFQAVSDLAGAAEVAEKRAVKLKDSSQLKRLPPPLEQLGAAKVSELKVILKADFRGSIEAIRKELEKFQHKEVRVRLLHAAIGGITESDVILALTSPLDTLIVGFNVVPDDRAHALAEEKGVQIREYDIIYKLTEDIHDALEGKLKPHEEVIHLGRAVVRGIFKISRVGTVAGCYCTQGVIERSAKIRLIREGVVIFPPSDRTASLESLKRFKEDAREVREGFECGLKLAGYDDIKVGDVVEAYRIEQVQRTL